jgi:hypothetical protein
MDWREKKRYHEARGLYQAYMIYQKRNGTYYVQAYLVGGRQVLPFNEHKSLEEAKAYAEAEEQKDRDLVARRDANAIVL